MLMETYLKPILENYFHSVFKKDKTCHVPFNAHNLKTKMYLSRCLVLHLDKIFLDKFDSVY